MKTDYKKLFSLFVSDNDGREVLRTPFKQDGRYCATDAHSMIYMPVETADLPFEERDKPNATKIIIQYDKRDKNDVINVVDFERQLVPYMIPATKDCDACGGEGSDTCNLGHDHDCEPCEGMGSVELRGAPPVADTNKKFVMLGVGYTYKQLRRVLDACAMLKLNTFTRTAGTKNGGNLFTCCECQILVMPCILDGEYKEPTEIKV